MTAVPDISCQIVSNRCSFRVVSITQDLNSISDTNWVYVWMTDLLKNLINHTNINIVKGINSGFTIDYYNRCV